MSFACPACNAENREARRYCHACAAALATPCPECGFENYARERYCGGCARDLGEKARVSKPASAAARPSSLEAEPPLSSSAERRQLTVMFCDMVGSTALSTKLDAEDLRDLLTRFQGACAAEVARFGGFIARYMGDGMLVYFGYPRAYEDSAVRAVRTGLAIVEAVAALGARPVQPRVRVGIATGPVVVGDILGAGQSEERSVVGETPNLAARLQGLAEPSTVVISERTRRLVAASFDLEDLGTHALKGLPDPVQAWRARRAARPEATRDAESPRQQLPLFGRGTELSLLKHRFTEAARGRGGVVVLRGGAGSGKSHLVDALTTHVGSQESPSALVVSHVCMSHHDTTTLFPVVEQMTRACGIELSDSRATRLEKVRRFVESWSDTVEEDERATRRILSLDEPDDTAPEGQKDAMLRSLWRRLGSARCGPMLIVFEDVQWADPTTLELVSGLLERSAAHPSLVVLTHRHDFEPPWPSVAATTSLVLGRLETDAARELVRSAMQSGVLDPALVDTIVERADGVPGFMVELTRAVIAAGGDTRVDALEGFQVPETLHDSLAAQLDDLGAARGLAQTAAAIGRHFTKDLLVRISGMNESTMAAHLESLVQAGLLLAPGGSLGPQYSFRHALLRDLAYERLLKSDRRRLHDAIASALIDELPDAAEADPVSVARHLVRAGRQRDASEWWTKAGTRAAAQGALPEAAAHLRCAVQALEEVVDRTSREDSAKLANLQIDLALRLRLLEGRAEGFSLLDRAEELVAPHQDWATLSHVFFARGNLHFMEGDGEACGRAHQRALELAEQSGSALAEVRALGGLADARVIVGDRKGSIELGERCVNLALEHGFETIAAANSVSTAFAHFWSLDAEAASKLIEVGERLGKKHRMARVVVLLRNMKALLAAEANDPDTGERILAEHEDWLGPDMDFGRLFFTGYRQFRVRGLWKEGHDFVTERLRQVQTLRGWGPNWQTLERVSLLAEAGESFESDLAERYEDLKSLPRNLTDFAAMSVLEALIHRKEWEHLAEAIEHFEDTGENDRVPRVALWLHAARAALSYAEDPANETLRAEVQRLAELAGRSSAASVELTLRELLADLESDARASAE